MNATTQSDTKHLQDVQLLNDELYMYIRLLLWSLILILSLNAVIVNVLNVLTFYTIGLVDSVSTCFFCLSVADVLSMITLLYCSCTALYSIISQAGDWVVHFSFLMFRSLYTSTDISAAITAYIAIQRAVCVAFPFFARHFFTKNKSLANKSLAVITALVVIILAFTLPSVASMRLIVVADPQTNSSVVRVHFTHTFTMANQFFISFVKIGLLFVEQVVMGTCLIVTTYGIMSSRNLRVLSSLSPPAAKLKPDSEERTKETKKAGDGFNSGAYNDENKIQNRQLVPETDERQMRRLKKEIRAIKQSVIVVLIHIICVTPRMVLSIVNLAEPRLSIERQNRNLYDVIYLALNVNDCINALMNFFVYFRFNDAFRTTVISLKSRTRSQ
ncbi:chemosensory receptor c [Plakobranchus ocellatus]|uniref:Chemosensory receptor c n=1 Tax=Plakobranchus ocellatus TaxID=259542 RepID=A0AAV4DW70_9GAST|nr:chemosensory receptor c [Plakobranchus ocellatus]